MSTRDPRSRLRLIVFDMDGVLVDIKSSWQFVHEAFGKNNMENLRLYEKGEITYSELMRRDILLWGHVNINRIQSILNEAPLMPGAAQTFERLRIAGLKTALISAGVSILAERLQAILKLDHIFANRILADQHGFLTGEGIVTVSLFDKLKVLNKLVTTESFSLAECAVVGDSSYDIPMLKKAGFSIAFNSDEKNVKESADIVVKKKDLREILPPLIRLVSSS